MKIVRQLQERIADGQRTITRRHWTLAYRVMRVLARDESAAWDVLCHFRPIVTLPSELVAFRIALLREPQDPDIPF